MRVVVACVAVLALLASGCGRMPATSSVPPRSFAAAAKEGFDVTKLRAAERRLSATPQLTSVLVMRHGRLVLEAYYHGMGPDRPWSMYSMTKSVVSAHPRPLTRLLLDAIES